MTLEAHISVSRGDFHLDVRLEASGGQVVALLGPNGSGKSTTLSALAGLVPLDAGRVSIQDRVIEDPERRISLTPERRGVSLVFQDYLLFPHLSALDNVAFGLRARGHSRREARRQAAEWLDRFDLGPKEAEKPRRLSGGQAQRVALARALATEPDLLLLDEPLAALDAGTRSVVRRDLRQILDEFGGSTVMVTHDPVDAFALASQVVVLGDGAVTQAGPIIDLTVRPKSRYVADLLGLNLLSGTAHGHSVALDETGATISLAEAAEGAVLALVHPHAVAVYTTQPSGSPRNQWPARIESFDLLGDRVRVRTAGPVPLVGEITAGALADLGLTEGQDVWIAVKATEISTYPR